MDCESYLKTMDMNLDWNKLGFNVHKTNAVMVTRFVDGAWTPMEADTSFTMSLNPYALVMHYAVACFEGLKAFRQKDGRVVMFRPDENAARLRRSAAYLGLPEPPVELFIQLCEECVRRNLDFLPPYGYGASMYLRPILMSVHPQIGLSPHPEVVFAVMGTPVGTYHGSTLKAFSAVIPGNYDRAAPKGSGSYKLAGNYAPTFRPYNIAHAQGYGEMLFLNSGTREFIDEFGSSNFFAIKDGTYITPLSDSVLPSITNKSLQVVATDLGLKVEKRHIPLAELAECQEVGACGTAVVLTPISRIDVKPVLEEAAVTASFRFCEDGAVGPMCTKLYRHLTGIQFGEVEDTHGWCHPVC